MKHIIVCCAICACLAGCSGFDLGTGSVVSQPAPSVASSEETTNETRPVARPESAVEDSVVAPSAPVIAGALGNTVASLGNPAEGGLWLKTPLVKDEQMGQVAYGGKTVDVTLIPIKGTATAGSRMSLQAFQALGAPLTELLEVSVSV